MKSSYTTNVPWAILFKKGGVSKKPFFVGGYLEMAFFVCGSSGKLFLYVRVMKMPYYLVWSFLYEGVIFGMGEMTFVVSEVL